MSSGSDRRRVYALAAREAGALARVLTRRLWALRPGAMRVPERLLIVPPDMRTSEATIASDIYAGYFVFGGRAVATGGRSPFAVNPPSDVWAEILYGFGWLRHLRAADTALARANARALVGEFLRMQSPPAARRAVVCARRAMSFLSQSPLILERADHVFYHKVMRALGRDIRVLSLAMNDHPKPQTRLFAAVAATYAGLSIEGFEGLARRATRALARELDLQILPDGGHVGRNPKLVLELLLDLLPLKQVYLARGVEPPKALLQAIDRIPPMLRLLRHGDGTLALFNGMGSTPVDHLTTLLFYDEARASPLQRGLVSGYERLEAKGALAIVDVGATPAPRFSAEAGAGALSFEFTIRGQRLVVNCGAPRSPADPVAQLVRATAAHSALVIEDASSAEFLVEGGWGALRLAARWLRRRLGPIVLRGVERTRVERPEPLRLVAEHDGYAARFGLLHERRLTLSANGDALDGEDRLAAESDRGDEATRGELRFHLHPGVRASLAQGGRVAMLVLPDGETWQFSAQARALEIEESIFLAATDGARKTVQIVLTFDPGKESAIAWRFERITGPR
ncbi:MAG: heparinase [Salinarimonadaceae bacterium]|nr:MAG: heparinase [Salinarimonadaceae bacterium]